MSKIVFFLGSLALGLVVGAGPAAATGHVAVEAEGGPGGATVEASLGDFEQSITAGTIDGTDNGLPGLCADGALHDSCTPAWEAGGIGD
jgi:hypothetical protein